METDWYTETDGSMERLVHEEMIKKAIRQMLLVERLLLWITTENISTGFISSIQRTV